MHDTALPHNQYYWGIGFNDPAVEGDWKWIDGSAASCVEWDSGEPDDSGDGEDCAHFIANQGAE